MVPLGASTQHGAVSVRLVTFNIRHGLLPDGRVDVGFLGEALAGVGADVVALQEVDRGKVRSGGVDTVREVAAAIRATEHRFLPAVAGTMEPRRAAPGAGPSAARGTALGDVGDPARLLEPLVAARGLRERAAAALSTLSSPAGRSAVGAYVRTWLSRRPARPDEPHGTPGYGIALLSRLPVLEWRRVRLPIASPWLFGRLQVRRDEPRVAIVAVVEAADGPLTVVTTHLSSGSDWSRVQLPWLQGRLRDLPRPLVLLGDLNLRGTVPSELIGWRDLVDEPNLSARAATAPAGPRPRRRRRARAPEPLPRAGAGPGDQRPPGRRRRPCAVSPGRSPRAVRKATEGPSPYGLRMVRDAPGSAESTGRATARGDGHATVRGDGRSETPEQRSDRNWNELLQELRVMQTGVQILTGFLLTLPFQARFGDLHEYQRIWYLVLVALSTVTTGLVIAPVATHRAVFGRHVKPQLVRNADRMTRAALLALAVTVTGVIGLVFDVVVGRTAGIVTSAITLVVLGTMWAVWPAFVRRHARD